MGHHSDLMIELREAELHEEACSWIEENFDKIEEGSSEWYEAETKFYEAMLERDLKEEEESYSDDFFDDNYYVKDKSRLDIFNEEMKNARSLNVAAVTEPRTEISLRIMLHGHIVAAMEGYLYFTFFDEAIKSDEVIQKYIKTQNKQKFTVKEILSANGDVKQLMRNCFKSTIFHNLSFAKARYKKVLNVDLKDTTFLREAVKRRHDCVHRAGFNHQGDSIEISEKDITDLVVNCESLVQNIAHQLAK